MSEFTVVHEEANLEAGAMRAVDLDGIRVVVSRYRRPEYVDAFWNVVNWREVASSYEMGHS